MLRRLLTAIFLLLLAVTYAAAGEFRIMSAEEVKKAIDVKKQVAVIDARSEKEFREGHVPGSLNVPPEKVGIIATLLPRDKDSLIIFYCRGAG